MEPALTSYVRYSAYYFFSSGTYAFVLAFLPLHCQAIGFTPFEIAAISAAATAASMLGSPLMLQAAHVRFAPSKLLATSALLAFCFFLPLVFVQRFALVFVAWALCIFTKRGADALVDAQAVRDSAEHQIRFEQVRTWGSIGFVILTFLFGWATDYWGKAIIAPLGALLLGGYLAVALPMAKGLPGSSRRASGASEITSETPAAPYVRSFLALLLSIALVWASHSVLYVYLSVYLAALGWSAAMMSFAWNLGVLAEILFFLSLKRFDSRLSLRSILQIGIAGTILRWCILYSTHDRAIILCSQLLHGLSFGACYIASMKLAHNILPDRLKDRGQGLLIAFGAGIGSLVGRYHAGALASTLASYREVQSLFGAAALMAVGALFASFAIKNSPNGKSETTARG